MDKEIEDISHIEKLKQEFLEALPSAIELAELTGDKVPLEPSTLGLGEQTIEDLSISERAAIGQAIWSFLKMPKGQALMEHLVEENYIQAPEGATIPGEIRERTFSTGLEGTFLHELLFSDGQKRFMVSKNNS